MTDQTFWALLDQARTKSKGDQDAMCDALRVALTKLTPEEIAAFGLEFARKVNAAYRWDLWGAAYLMNGGCSDDGFEYFRRWLVAMGKDVYEGVLKDPDSLADAPAILLIDDCADFELIVSPSLDAYEEKTGKDLLDEADYPNEQDPAGETFDFDDDEEMQRRYPRLYKKHA